MRKNLLNSFRALLLSLAMLVSLPMLAEEAMVDGINFNLDSGTYKATVIALSGDEKYSGDLVIPTTVFYKSRSYTVIGIGESAFKGCNSLTSVTIPPNNVTSVGDNAFYGCTGLKSATIGNSVTSIGNSAFYGCTGLTSVIIGSTVESIGDNVFNGCTKLLAVYSISENAPATGEGTFANSSIGSATLYVLSDYVPNYKSAPWNSFGSIAVFPRVEIDGINYELYPDKKEATVIAKSGDAKYSGKISIPDSIVYANSTYSVTTIGFQAFRSSNVSSVTFPKSLKAIGQDSFRDCRNLNSITIPDNVTYIFEFAFSSCKNLTSVIIGNGVKEIWKCAFDQCRTLTSVTIGCNVESIGRAAFNYCAGLLDVYCYAENVPSTDNDAFSSSNNRNAILHVPAASIESYKTTSPWSSFRTIKAFPQAEINGVNYQLYPGFNLATVIAKSGDAKYSGDIEIPASVEYSGTTYSVTSIGDETFYGCSGLTSVTISNSVTSIGDNAFEGCSGLTSVTIGNSVENIGEYCFGGCSNLASITVDEGNTKYDSRDNCNAIIETETNTLVYGCKSTVIPSGVTSIGYAAFSGCSGLTSVTIPNSVTNIGDNAFYQCTDLTSVTIPNSVTSIGEWAFYCTGLTSLTIPNSVESIGDCAFQACTGLTSITIGNSVNSIGSVVFMGCTGLTSITVDEENEVYDSRNGCNAIIHTATGALLLGCNNTVIPNGVKSIEEAAFFSLTTISSIVIPNGVTSISKFAFSYCLALESVTMPSSIESLGTAAFEGCSALKTIYCYAENTPETEAPVFSRINTNSITLHVPANAVNSYKEADVWSDFGKIAGIIDVSPVGYATLYLDYNAEIPEDVEVYVASEVDGDRLKMQKVEGVLPAQTGVIIKADEGKYDFAWSNEEPAYIEGNLLEGSATEADITAEENTTYYVLSAPGNENVGMYPVKLTDDGAFVCQANKAYLPISSAIASTARIYFDFGTETGIGEVKTEGINVKTETYDLSGRKVQNAQNGIFIVNGNKVVK